MVAIAFALMLTPLLLGPDTDVLIVADGCPPCEIVKRAVRFEQDTIIANKKIDVKIIRQFNAQGVPTPTLIVRSEGRVIRHIVGASEILRYWQ